MSPLNDLRHELSLLVLSRYPLVVIESAEESKVEELVERVAQDLGISFLSWSATAGLERPNVGLLGETQEPKAALARVGAMMGEVVVLFKDLDPWLDRPEVARSLRDVEQSFSGSRSTLVLCGSHVDLPTSLAALTARLQLALPDTRELERLVRDTSNELANQRRTTIDLDAEGVSTVARSLRGLNRDEARRLIYQAALDDGCLDLSDLPGLLAGKRRRVRDTGLLDWVEPLAGLEAVGGAGNFKRWVERRTDAFSEAARRFGLEPPRGVLLVGVPGTGKSLVCRAVSGQWQLPLLSLDPGRLYNKYVGESEANLRRVLTTAEAMAPAILWVDEIEKALATGTGGNDDGLSRRLLGTILKWMQDRPSPVFVMATANDVGRLPVELLRRGRFDEVFFFDLPGAPERAKIFAIHLERRERDARRFALAVLAEASEGFSGAEIEGVVVAALYHAFSERSEITNEILLAEIDATRPLSQLRPDDIARLRDWGREHAVPA